jgi:hypothetical protein
MPSSSIKPKKAARRLAIRISAYEAFISRLKQGAAGYKRPGSLKK